MGESLQRALELEGWRVMWWRSGGKRFDPSGNIHLIWLFVTMRLGDMSGEYVFRLASERDAEPLSYS